MDYALQDDGDLLFRLLSAERALADAESQYQRIADALPYGIWTCGPDGELIHISKSFLDLVGMTLEDCQQFGWWDKIPEEGLEEVREHWMHCQLNGVPYRRETKLKGTDGKWHHVLVCAVPVRDDQGLVISWVGINMDIDERKRQEAALRESEQRFRMLADEAPVVIWMSDWQGHFNYANRRWFELTGMKPQEMAEDGWLDCVHPDDRAELLAASRAARVTRQAFEASFRVRTADGEYRTLLDRGAPRFLPTGAFTGFVGCCIDITPLKEAQEKEARATEGYRMICEAVQGLLYDWNVADDFVVRSNALYALIGVAPKDGEPTFEWWRSRIHPEDLPRVERGIAHDLSAHGVYEMEYRVWHADGRFVPVSDRGLCSYDSERRVSRVVGCVASVETTLETMEELRRLATLCPGAAFALCPEGHPTIANGRALALFECDLRRFQDSWISLVHRDDRAEIAARCAAAFQGKSGLTAAFRLERSEAELILELSPVSGSAGTIGFFASLVEVSGGLLEEALGEKPATRNRR